ncbi:MAG: aldehyde dehydrogenase family protein [Acidobacteria bacterium]|nr:aldehyde dehydrogenase family protein [Acidobacteriota bacterium]
MTKIEIADIKIGNRYRNDYGDIKGLAKSIQEIGLLQPICITPGNMLISGERRIKAHAHLGLDSIEATVIPLGDIAAALAAGNAVVFKPSERCPRLGRAIASLFNALPEGTVTLLEGGAAEARALVAAEGSTGKANGNAIDGVTVTGVTVHLVTAELDNGPIVIQRTVQVMGDDTPDTLTARILVEEHRAYAEAVGTVLDGGWRVEGRRFVRSGNAASA